MNTGKILLNILISLTISQFAYAEEDTEQRCLSHESMQEISTDFKQIEKLLKENTDSYCEADLGEEWFEVAESLIILKNINPAEVEEVEDDAFTHQAISAPDWWEYFTDRADRFVIRDDCGESVGAFVQVSPLNMGKINLCQRFFELSVYRQVSILMHEVRHFDGHSHVTCTRGNEFGNSGACDRTVSQKGSYAISLQTLVGMAKGVNIPEEDRLSLQASAVYNAFNKFNEVPQVKLKQSIYLSHMAGDVIKWNLDDDSVEHITVLEDPAKVVNSANKFTIYPIDSSKDAYRLESDLETVSENEGLFAKKFNKESLSEKDKYKDISYMGTAGMLKDNTLITTCGDSDLVSHDLDEHGVFKNFISSADAQNAEVDSLLVAETGEIFAYNCNEDENMEITKLKFTLHEDVKSLTGSFGLSGIQFALLANGELVVLEPNGFVLKSDTLETPFENQDWLSATPFSSPEIFN